MADDIHVAITATSCEPTERDAPKAAALLQQRDAMAAEVHAINRAAALRTAGDAYFTRCACGWQGLRVADPEVARREYDVHSCRMTGEVGVRLHRVEELPPQWAEETKRKIEEAADLMRERQREAVEHQRSEFADFAKRVHGESDDFVQRVQMLEMK